MNIIIPFEKREKFSSKVEEICSISLEHEITKNAEEVLGNFIISGTYKEHELSVNTSDFKFIMPFEVALTRKVDLDTIEFSIDNFTYELDSNELVIKIDYVLEAEDIKEERIFEKVQERLDPIDIIEENDTIEKEEAINMIPNKTYEDDFITYKVHFVKKEDTIESICLKYSITKEELEKINDITILNKNDKLLIPINE